MENICKEVDGVQVLKNISFKVLKGDKIALVGSNSIAKTTLFKILMGEVQKDKGKITFGSTIKKGYVPNDNSSYFVSNDSITKWLGDETGIEDETILRSFLGRMLFSGDEALKAVNVLSGGEKARCMFSRVMLQDPNLIFLDEPTNHLDLESITALNNGLIRSTAEIIFVSHDHQFTQTVANRIIEQNHDKMKKEINF